MQRIAARCGVARNAAFEAPAQRRLTRRLCHDYLGDQDRLSIELEAPGRPRLRIEAQQAGGHVGIHQVGHIALHAQRIALAVRLEPRFDAVHQHHASAWRMSRRQQQRVIAARTRCADGSGCETAKAIGFEPLMLELKGIERLIDARHFYAYRWYRFDITDLSINKAKRRGFS